MDKQKTGELIRNARIKKGYTQVELGDLIGVTNKAISPAVSAASTLVHAAQLMIHFTSLSPTILRTASRLVMSSF